MATGSVAGAVLLLVLLLYLLRLRRQRAGPWRDSGGPLLETSEGGGGFFGALAGGANRGKRSGGVFPESAWLYDPIRPSSRGEARGGSDESNSNSNNNNLLRPNSDDTGRTLSTNSSPGMYGQDRFSRGAYSAEIVPGMVELPASSQSPSPPPRDASSSPPPGPRERASYPPYAPFVRPVAPEISDDSGDLSAVSPLLPAPPRPFARPGAQPWSAAANSPSGSGSSNYGSPVSASPRRSSRPHSHLGGASPATPLNAIWEEGGSGIPGRAM